MFVIGHRGAAGHAVENTLTSFRKAIELGVDFIEMDVQVTRDGRLVLFHDRTLYRMTGRTGRIEDFTYAELYRDFVLKGSERIPLFEETCEFAAETGTKLYVEVKAAGIETEVVAVLGKHLDDDAYLLAAFHHEVIVEFKRLKPESKTIALLKASPLKTSFLKIGKLVEETRCDYIGFNAKSINLSSVNEVHLLGVGALVYTVDEPEEIKKMTALGVDGIVSNFPERVGRKGFDRHSI